MGGGGGHLTPLASISMDGMAVFHWQAEEQYLCQSLTLYAYIIHSSELIRRGHFPMVIVHTCIYMSSACTCIETASCYCRWNVKTDRLIHVPLLLPQNLYGLARSTLAWLSGWASYLALHALQLVVPLLSPAARRIHTCMNIPVSHALYIHPHIPIHTR